MSLPKTMENNGEMRTSAKPKKLYINRKVLMRATQKCTSYWIWATMSKVVGIFVKFWQFFTMPAHHFWSYQVTQEVNFEILLICPKFYI